MPSNHSRLLRHFGTITPHQQPEDCALLREAFEQGIADEPMTMIEDVNPPPERATRTNDITQSIQEAIEP
jgi:hypothetical protein